MGNENDAREILGRFTGGLPVYLAPAELGVDIVVSRDAEHCARFFKPWNVKADRRILRVGREYCISFALANLVAGGLLNEVLVTLRTLPAWQGRRLQWPDSVLMSVAVDGPNDEARALLASSARWQPPTAREWSAAGVYWLALFGDNSMATHCFEKAYKSLICHTRMEYTLDLSRVVSRWIGATSDSAAAMHCLGMLWNYLGSLNYPPNLTVEEREELVDMAEIWKQQLDHAGWAERVLRLARYPGAPHYCKTFSQFRLASAWLGIMNNRELALEIAEKAMKDPEEDACAAVIFWRCLGDHAVRIEECLNKKDWQKPEQATFTVSLAKHIVSCSTPQNLIDKERHAKAILDATWEMHQSDAMELAIVAEGWSRLFGAGLEERLDDLVQAATQVADALPMADTWMQQIHLPLASRQMKCRAAIERAEALSGEAMDWSFCAEAWKRNLGDLENVERCLRAGEPLCHDVQALGYITDGWARLLGRDDEALRLILSEDLDLNFPPLVLDVG